MLPICCPPLRIPVPVHLWKSSVHKGCTFACTGFVAKDAESAACLMTASQLPLTADLACTFAYHKPYVTEAWYEGMHASQPETSTGCCWLVELPSCVWVCACACACMLCLCECLYVCMRPILHLLNDAWDCLSVLISPDDASLPSGCLQAASNLAAAIPIRSSSQYG